MKRFLTVLVASLFLASATYAAEEKAKVEEKKTEAKEKAKGEEKPATQVRLSSLPEGRWPLPTFPTRALGRLLPKGELVQPLQAQHWFNLVSKSQASVLPCFRKTTEGRPLRFFLTVPSS